MAHDDNTNNTAVGLTDADGMPDAPANRAKSDVAPGFGDIERRAAALAARLAGGRPGGGLPGTSLPKEPRFVAPLQEWRSVEDGHPRAGIGHPSTAHEGRSAGHAPKRGHYVAAVIHEDDRDMDRLEIVASPRELRRWESDGRHDRHSLNPLPDDADTPASAMAARPVEPSRHMAPASAAAFNAPADSSVSDATADEPDMSLALRDITQFISRQLQAQRELAADAAPLPLAAASVRVEAETEPVSADAPSVMASDATLAADAQQDADLSEIERQIRSLTAAFGADEASANPDPDLTATWRAVAEAEPSSMTVADIEIAPRAEFERAPTDLSAIEAVGMPFTDSDDYVELPSDSSAFGNEAADNATPAWIDESVEVSLQALEQQQVATDADLVEIFDERQFATTMAEVDADAVLGDRFAVPEMTSAFAPALALAAAQPDAADDSTGERLSAEPANYDDTVLVARVDELESQIVGLCDRLSDSERRLSDTLLSERNVDERRALEETIASSAAFATLQTEMRRLTDQRSDYEAHYGDSLDALHDAIRDLSDRIGQIERTTGRSEDPTRSAAGIASSVLTSRLIPDDSGPRAVTRQPGVPSGVASPVGENLPVWLDDGAAEADGGRHVVETPADVFASRPEAAVAALEPESELAPRNRPKPNFVMPELSERRETVSIAAVAANVAKPSDMRRRSPVVEDAAVHEEDTDDEDVSYLPTARSAGGQDESYLKSVRATVAARGAQMAELEEATGRSRTRGPVLGSLIDAARQGEQEAQRERNAASGRASAGQPEKPSGRSNLLFVATTLVLFVTSAMLLYGMSRQGVGEGSVVKLNAVEEQGEGLPLARSPLEEGGAPAIETRSRAEDAALAKETQPKPVPLKKDDKRSEFNGIDASTAPVRLSEVGTSIDSERAPAALVQRNDDITVTASLPDTAAMAPSPMFAKRGSAAADKPVASNGANGIATPVVAAPVEPVPSLPAEIAPLTVRMGALNGDARAQHEVARNYEKGGGVRADAQRALSWYQRSAHLGYAPSIYRLALLHERGEGVARNLDKAVELYLAAAEMGNVNAMHNLGVVYSGGQLGKADYTEAVRWYGKAAEFGIKDSQVNLAIIYQNGLGVERDLSKAYKWYTVAADAGDEEARQIAAAMRSDFDGNRRGAIEQEAHSFKAAAVPVEANYQISQIRTLGNVRVFTPAGE